MDAMWASLRALLSRSKTMNVALGDVVFETRDIHGQNSHSVMQWR